MLKATTEFRVDGAVLMLTRLCEHFAEHGEVRLEAARGSIALAYGSACLAADDDRLHVTVEAADETYLAYMKLGLVEHVHEFAGAPRPLIRWSGDGVVTGTPPFFRELQFVSSDTLTPHMRRVRLHGSSLARFAEGGLHARLLFPPAGRAPVWPTLSADGSILWAEGEDKLESRVYTIRAIDPEAGWLDVDIVLHDDGHTPGSRLALRGVPGETIGMTGPGGGHVPEASRLLLVGDDTALPAIARILDALPASAVATVLIEVDGPTDEIALTSKASVSLRYLHRLGALPGSAALLPNAVRSLDFDELGEDLFVWAGCEHADFRALRNHLRHERRVPRERHLVVAYWRRADDRESALTLSTDTPAASTGDEA